MFHILTRIKDCCPENWAAFENFIEQILDTVEWIVLKLNLLIFRVKNWDYRSTSFSFEYKSI